MNKLVQKKSIALLQILENGLSDRKLLFSFYSLLLLFTFIVASCERTFEYDVADVPPFESLEAPAQGEGFQIHVPPFPVPANYEREFYVRMPVGNKKHIYVNKFEVRCRPGTHHTIAYGYENENDPSHPPIGVIRDQNLPDGNGNFNLTMGSGTMYCGAQNEDFFSEFPEGVAVRIPANATLDINSHYFNRTDATIFGEVFLNLYTIPLEEVTELLETDLISNDDQLFLPPNKATNIEDQKLFGRPTEIRQMFSHMHKRGYFFRVHKIGGDNHDELLYEAFDYRHPPYKFFDPPLKINSGEGLRTVVGYNNETDREIKYGVTSEDEMGILFYYKVNW
ncbi:MAG: hypothetical protein AAF806_26880 [Bacteroidota bacterium]